MIDPRYSFSIDASNGRTITYRSSVTLTWSLIAKIDGREMTMSFRPFRASARVIGYLVGHIACIGSGERIASSSARQIPGI
jgi:hypothetical protein